MSSAVRFCTIQRKHTRSDVIGLFLGKRARRKTFPPVPISLVVGFCIPNLGNVVILPARFLLLHRAFSRHEVSEGRGCTQDEIERGFIQGVVIDGVSIHTGVV